MQQFIEAKEMRLQVLLSNAQDVYKVPLYQRPYAWSKDQWEDLFEDLKSIDSKKDVHFLGSIVVVPSPHTVGINYFELVDGQQRLATILIWLSAIRDIARDRGDEGLAERLTKQYLIVEDVGSGEKVLKLQLGELDRDAFGKVIRGEKKDDNHLIFECYEYFKGRTESNNNVEMWRDLLNNISIVHINAFSHFNAFRLFETLNDRGLELSAADLIKNFLLMKVSSKKAVFDETISHWSEMYEKVRDKEPVKFIRRYILSNYRGKVSESRLYDGVKRKLELDKNKSEDPEKVYDFVKDLNHNATIYKKILECSFSDDKINKRLQELHLVEVAPSFTLFLKIMRFLEERKISEDEILEIMRIVESFHIRWGVCKQSTSRLDQIYNHICMELEGKQPNDFKEVIKGKLQSEISNNANDEVFKRNFCYRSFKPDETRTKYVLWKLSKPSGETILNVKEIQTEHILPRKLSKEWVEYLEKKTSKVEEEIRALHKENLDRIGNLTIIKGEWNIGMSNRLFDNKKKDYDKSEIKITNELSKLNEWTFREIEKRSKRLAEDACEIWSFN